MQMTLEEWQGRLEEHFESLAKVRSNSNAPIFALDVESMTVVH